ncbi:ATP-binding cassette domain-containing protein [Micromonospora rifamycinica]|uniref:ABC-2 type transport system ATP-binding protein n=1 Tax=Micromonospora rifamycinica TaxID=291594 RepID=A0A109IMC8_9ACTN|nr:ATP-binding cassette domain-containing protein [Micromonospora rifamycinica]KWV33168.1 ABC transporter [Micromonospora rifamycinica]SCG51094.1 ABC-2 type transport system ATP-binding protein [Micromonospora rifamycinica]
MIEATGLRKSYRVGRGRKAGTVEAVRGVDFAVGRGEIVGFLGPNGAGKSTTLRMLATLIRPDGGRATIAGVDLLRAPAQVRRQIGFVAQSSGTYDDSTARRDLVLQARLYGLTKAEAQQRAEAAIGAFQLDDFADRRIRTYSGGQRRRLDVALGVIHSPQVIFLDEPTAGLDPPSRVRMWQEVRRLRAEGMTVFLTTHYLDEADTLCDRVSIIDGGRIVAEGTPSDLKREISGDVVAVDLTRADVVDTDADSDLAAAGKLLGEQPYVHSSETVDGTLRLYVDSAATAIPQIMRTLLGRGIEPGAIEARRPSLDDVFLAKTGRSLEE